VLKSFLVIFFALPLYGHSQSYADSPFYKPISAIPASAHDEYTRHGNIKANRIVIDLSVNHWRMSVPETAPEFEESIGSASHLPTIYWHNLRAQTKSSALSAPSPTRSTGLAERIFPSLHFRPI
jgi:hypothetical protein